jgi:hypothetical protein
MPRCAFLTMENLHGFVSDDELAHAPLRMYGWHVETVPWRRCAVAWDQFDSVVIRSAWDYHHAHNEFLTVLRQIQDAGAHLENSLALVQWNINKTYLRDLERRGVPIVPTAWGSELGPVDERTILGRLGGDEIVLKPVVSANAEHTYRLRRGSAAWAEAANAFAHREYLAQPFVQQIVTEGEFSLFYFNGEQSHAILKKPKGKDFRVQEEHGGRIEALAASGELLQAGEQVMAAIGPTPLYARVDLVHLPDGTFHLMELELIEPSLYFRMDANSPMRFAHALDARMRSKAT